MKEVFEGRKEGFNAAPALVESVRIDGKPRRKIVSYLGSIGERRLTYTFHQADFWIAADKNLDALGLTNADRLRIESALAQIVQRPSPDSLAAAQKGLKDIERKLKEKT